MVNPSIVRIGHGVTVVAAAAALVMSLAVSAAGEPIGPVEDPSPPPDCGVSETLVPTCDGSALFGAATYDRTAPMPWGQRIMTADSRYGRPLTIAHSYAKAPVIPFDPSQTQGKGEIARADSGTSIVWDDWKPAADWSTVTGSDSSVNAMITRAADNIKAVGPHKVMLGVAAEPEKNVGGGTDCALKGGQPAGNTPDNYRAMWANIHQIFAAEGATNVVWVMNYMGYAGWNCLVPQMWPGNDLVDWVAWDPYAHGRTWDAMVDVFYSFLSDNSDADHAYSSKPYMLGEYGDGSDPQPTVYTFYDQAKQALDAGTYPNLRAYVVFDSWPENITDLRTGYDDQHQADPTEQQHFNAFAQDPNFLPSVTN